MLKKYTNWFILSAILVQLLAPGIANAAPLSPGERPNANNPTAGRVEGECETLSMDDCPFIRYTVMFVNLLGGLVGIICVIVIAVGGVQYTTSRDNPQTVAAARQRITNALTALVAYMIMLAFLQWLVPGGVYG